MEEKKDISERSDICLLVDCFYTAVRTDALIGPIFDRVVGEQWPVHLQKMYGFWETVLFGAQAYTGSPFPPHAKLNISQAHFDRWLLLWHNTIDLLFNGEKADEAKWRGDKMALMFVSKIEYYTTRKSDPLI